MKRLLVWLLLLTTFASSHPAMADPIGISLGIGGNKRLVDDTLLPTYAWDPRDITGAIFYLPAWNTGSMWTENSAGTPATRPSIDTDPVGIIQEPVGAFFVGVASDAGRPLLNSDATINSSLKFTSNNQSLVVMDSLKALRLFHAYRQFTVLAKVKFEAVAGGTANAIIDNSRGTSTLNGIYVRRNTNGTLLVQVAGGGSSLVSFSTTATVNDTNWHYLRIWGETDGTAQIHVRIDGGADEASNMGAAVDADATDDMRIGNKSNGSTTMNGSIADLLITNTPNVSDADYALWLAYNPTRNSSTTALQRIYAAGNSLDVDESSGLYFDYDASLVSTMWTTSAKAAQVANNTDPVGWIENTKAIPTGCGSFTRHAIQSTDANRPTFATNVSNSLGALLFAGNTTDTSTHAGDNSLLIQGTAPRGAVTHIIVYRNTTTDPGSHLLWHSNVSYLAVGGAANSTVNRRDLAVVHPASGTPLVSATNPNGGDSFGIVVIRQEGATAKIWMCNRYDLSEVGSATDWGLWNPARIGATGDTNWDLAGNVCQYTKYYTAHSDSTIRKLVNGLATKWGISNIPTTLDNVARLDRGRWYERLIAGAYGEDQPEYVAALLGK